MYCDRQTSYCDRQTSYCDRPVIIFVLSETFSEMGADTEKEQFGLGYGQKIVMEVVVYFKQKIKNFIKTKQIVWNRLLQISASLYSYI